VESSFHAEKKAESQGFGSLLESQSLRYFFKPKQVIDMINAHPANRVGLKSKGRQLLLQILTKQCGAAAWLGFEHKPVF
jgi:hypothetical protein